MDFGNFKFSIISYKIFLIIFLTPFLYDASQYPV